MARWEEGWWPPSRPRPAKGGIRSKSRRGAFAESWWGRRWILVLEGFSIGGRLERGRSYARRGQVLDIRVEPGEVTARVQGSRKRPYEVSIMLEPLTPEERAAVAGELARRPRLSAALLAGEMREELENAFGDAGVPLFPAREGDLETDCSCPDWSNPCKHIAAVYYLVAEELDRDPFLLLRLRGLSRADLVVASSGSGGSGLGATSPPVGAAPAPAAHALAAPAPSPSMAEGEGLPADPGLFWRGARAENADDAPDGSSPEESSPPGSADLLRALGRVPFWRGRTEPDEVLGDIVARAATLGVELLAGAEGVEDER